MNLKVTVQAQIQYLGYIIDPSFYGVNRPADLWKKKEKYGVHQTGYRRCFLANGEIKDYNVMINGKIFWSTSKKWSNYI